MSTELIQFDRDAVTIGKIWQKACNSLIDSNKYYIECGIRLKAKKAKLTHGEWLPWLKANRDVLGFKDRTTATRLMKAANDASTHHLDEVAAVSLNRLIWGNDNTRGTQGTGENEWYTPAMFIDLARKVLGAIDLDPATSVQANKQVKAKRIFTSETDGLSEDWKGNIWLNPPYAQPAIQHFADKMVAEVDAGHVTAAIMLTHNYTDTAWFQKLGRASNALCFTRGRIRFEAPDGELAAPTQGQAFFYFGENVPRFAEVFADVGFIADVIHTST
jgi:ParB family chromosome partitioning protein